MSDLQLILEGVVLALLLGYLCLKQSQRSGARSGSLNSAEWSGKAIDVSRLKSGLADTRAACRRARHSTTGLCFHRALLALARHSVTRFKYFDERASGEQVDG